MGYGGTSFPIWVSPCPMFYCSSPTTPASLPKAHGGRMDTEENNKNLMHGRR